VGAGDCAGSYFFKKQDLQNVYVIDSSLKSRQITNAYGLKHSFKIAYLFCQKMDAYITRRLILVT